MTFKRAFRLFVGALVLALVCLSCTKKDQAAIHGNSHEKPSAEECRDIQIPASVKLEGRFVAKFLQCLETQGGHAPVLVNAIERLGEADLQRIIDLLRFQPAANNNSHPIFLALATFLDRGVFDLRSGTVRDDLFTDRFELMQNYLVKLAPQRLAGTIMQMQRAGGLAPLLDHLSDKDDLIDSRPLLAFAHELLLNPQLAQSLSNLLEVMSDSSTYPILSEFFSAQQSTPLANSDREDVLLRWLTPKPTGYRQPSITGRGNKLDNGFRRYEQWLGQQDVMLLQRVAGAVDQFVQNWSQLSEPAQRGLMANLGRLTGRILWEQDSPIKGMLAFSYFFFRQVDAGRFALRTEQMQELVDAIQILLQDAGPAVFAPFNQKVGSSILHDYMEKLVWRGGAIPGCGSLTLTGIAAVSDNERLPGYLRVMHSFFAPNRRCSFGLSPLASAVFTKLYQDLDCQSARQRVSSQCLQGEDFKRIAEQLALLDFSELSQPVEPAAELLSTLILSALKEMEVDLGQDNASLYWQRLARGLVPLSVIHVVREKINNAQPLTVAKIAALDEELNKDGNMRRFLREDFLENLIREKISYLSVIGDTFANLFGAEGSDEKILRIFSGTYTGGPLESALQKHFYLKFIAQRVAPPPDVLRATEVMARLREKGNLFWNNRLDRLDEQVDYRLLGRKERSSEISFQGNGELKGFAFKKEPLRAFDVTQPDFWRLAKLVKGDVLWGVNVDSASSASLKRWIS